MLFLFNLYDDPIHPPMADRKNLTPFISKGLRVVFFQAQFPYKSKHHILGAEF